MFSQRSQDGRASPGPILSHRFSFFRELHPKATFREIPEGQSCASSHGRQITLAFPQILEGLATHASLCALSVELIWMGRLHGEPFSTLVTGLKPPLDLSPRALLQSPARSRLHTWMLREGGQQPTDWTRRTSCQSQKAGQVT